MTDEKKAVYDPATEPLLLRLQKSRIAFQNAGVKKSGYNPFAKFKYFTLDDILPVANRIFCDYAICARYYENTEYGYLEIINAFDRRDLILFQMPKYDAAMKGASPIQEGGASKTYTKRFLYLDALEISEPETIDALDQKEQIEAKPITEKQLAEIRTILSDNPARMESMLKAYQIKDVSELTEAKAKNVLRRLREGK